jgi:hypothetical protein
MTVDRQRQLIASEARVRQLEDESGAVPSPGAPCRVTGCTADTRLGTLAGGGPMLCEGFGARMGREPCIARWLMETDTGSYEDWLTAQELGDRTRDF